jgi:CheY-like chemotaxis protein
MKRISVALFLLAFSFSSLNANKVGDSTTKSSESEKESTPSSIWNFAKWKWFLSGVLGVYGSFLAIKWILDCARNAPNSPRFGGPFPPGRLPDQAGATLLSVAMGSVSPRRLSPRNEEQIAMKRRFSVLLVEDNETFQTVFRSQLRAAGHEVTIAGNGQIAVDLARETTFDLILMDNLMPVMGGLEATAALRGIGVTTPIILHSTESYDEKLWVAFERAGGNARLMKGQVRQEKYDELFDTLIDMAHAKS